MGTFGRTRQGHQSPQKRSTPGAYPTLAGRVLGSYTLIMRLGEGGMGVVYMAEHLRLNRQVAIKVLRRELASQKETVRRFFNEARSVNDIGHPNIVEITDFVEKFDEDPPIVYMVLELLSGETLAAHIEEHGPMDPDDAVRVAIQITDALMAVHEAKVLHRDLKPENIFLLEQVEGEERRVKLLDFGVAKDMQEEDRDAITEPGITVGTPEFMAPEQILDRPLDVRVDIYVVGMVLYAMLTGGPPFKSDALNSLLRMHLKEPPEPIANRREGGKRVPARLESLVMRCMEKNPDKRYQTAGELNEALRACQPGYKKQQAEARASAAGSSRWILMALGLAVVVLAAAVVALLLVN